MATFQGFQALFSVFILYSRVVVSSTNPSLCTRGSYSCDSGYVCCNNKCVLGLDCYGQYCTLNSHCSIGESCCNSQCKDGIDCIGQSCSVNSDCAGGSFEYCCDGTCSYDSCYDATAVILGSIFGTIFIFVRFLGMHLLRLQKASSSPWKSDCRTESYNSDREDNENYTAALPTLCGTDTSTLPTRLPILPPTSVWTTSDGRSSTIQPWDNCNKWSTSPL